jgi:hypothetical protein
MTGRHRGRTRAWPLAAAVLVLSARPVAAATFDFVHVEANAGGSSGGHAAVCFPEHCYHFQQAADAELLLVREPRERFEHAYRVLGNRTLVVRRVQVSDTAAARIDETFAAYHRRQRAQLAVRDGYRADRELLTYLSDRAHGTPDSGRAPRPAATGYFFAVERAGDAGAPKRSHRTAALAQRIRAAYGADFLTLRAHALAAEIRALQPPAAEVVSPEAAAMLAAPSFFAERYRELLSGYLAVSALRDARGLDSGALIALTDPALVLSQHEQALVRAYADELETELARLVTSQRPDWGFPLLVGLARLLALDASLASGTLMLLDTFPSDAPAVSFDTWAGYEDALALLVAERRQDFLRLRAAFFEGDSRSEARWSNLEKAGNLWFELRRAQQERASMRVPGDLPLPERGAWQDDWPIPMLSGPTLDAALAAAAGREQAYRSALREQNQYDLVARNCATELLRGVEAGLTGDAGDGREIAQVDPDGLLTFIPFVAAHAVGARYPIAQTYEAPSYRLATTRARGDENPVSAYLREVNVLTSRTYRWHRADPIFLLFTDGTPVLRPFFGVANLVTSVLVTAVGIVALPADSGALLGNALNGALYSLPELAFVSIRKGSFPIAPRAWLHAPGDANRGAGSARP